MQRPQSRFAKISRCLASPLVVVLTAGLAAAGFTPPTEAVLPEHAQASLRDDLTAGHWSDAVNRIEAARTAGTALAKIDDRLISVSDWVDTLVTDPASRTAMSAQYEKVAGAAASAAMAAGIRDGDVTAIAQAADRYPWTQAAAKAQVAIAMRLAAVGDLRGVQSMLRTAPSSDADALTSLKPLADLPADGPGKSIAFSADWYTLVRPVDYPRSVPVAAKDAIFLASPTAAAAINLQGRPIWSIGHEPLPIEMPKGFPGVPRAMQAAMFGDHSLAQPALWCEPGGAAKIVVVRQSERDTSTLAALRAGDGSLLWNTGKTDAASGLLFMASPTVVGRYVYSLALDYQPPVVPRKCIVAIDLPSGRLLWRSTIGDASLPTLVARAAAGGSSNGNIVNALISGCGAELVTDDRNIYASFEGGSIIAIDRFGGQTRWIATYSPQSQNVHEISRLRESKKKSAFRRWRDRVLRIGAMAVVAPADSTAVLAFDAKTGRQLWKFDAADKAELVGEAGGNIILAGEQLIAIHPDGTAAWQTNFTNEPTGPAVIDGENIYTPTQSGGSAYAGDDGKASLKTSAATQSLEPILKQQATRKTLETLGIFQTFDSPDAGQTAGPQPKPSDKTAKPSDKPNPAGPGNNKSRAAERAAERNKTK